MPSSWQIQASSTASTPTYSLIRNILMEPKHTFPSSISAVSRQRAGQSLWGLWNAIKRFLSHQGYQNSRSEFHLLTFNQNYAPLQLWKSTGDLKPLLINQNVLFSETLSTVTYTVSKMQADITSKNPTTSFKAFVKLLIDVKRHQKNMFEKYN